MTALPRTNLYQFFLAGDRPTQGQFQDLIDSSLNIADVSGQFIQSDVSCGGTFEVSGALTVRNNINVAQNLVVSGNTTLTGPVVLNSNLTISNLTVVSAFAGNTISISGTVSAQTANITGSISGSSLNITTSGAAGNPAITLPGSAGIFTQGPGTVCISNTSAEVARFDNTGSFLINTTNNAPFSGAPAALSPGYIVVDLGTSATHNGLEIISGSNGFIPAVLGFNNGITGNLMYFAASAVNVGVISTDGTNTTYGTSSDLRKKELLSDYDPDELFDRVKVWNFNWKSNNKRDVGCVAQELYELVPNAVSKGDDNAGGEDEKGFESWHISYSTLVPYLIAEIKSLRKRMSDMEKS